MTMGMSGNPAAVVSLKLVGGFVGDGKLKVEADPWTEPVGSHNFAIGVECHEFEVEIFGAEVDIIRFPGEIIGGRPEV